MRGAFEWKRYYFHLILFLIIQVLVKSQPKGYLYDESKVENYELPNPLICNDGTKVNTKKIWINKRRQEILHLFENEVYGVSPAKPKHIVFKEVERDKNALAGKAIRRQVIIELANNDRALNLNLLIYFPKAKELPIPGFLTINFHGNHTVHKDPAIKIPTSWVRNQKWNKK